MHHKRNDCRICGSDSLIPFISLGPTPLANAFLPGPDEFSNEVSYPLDVYFCQTCSLVQLMDVVDKETLFRNYIYVTGTSDTMADHNCRYAETVVELLGLEGDDLVVEIASNDGSLLQCFRTHGVKTLGIEPATNIAAMSQSRGLETINDFFDSSVAQRVRESYGPAQAVIANNVLAHVDNTRDFLSGARDMLSPEGLLIFEAPYLGELIQRLEYDTIYHEHLCYFSITPLLYLCDAIGLSIIRVDHVPVHGGSLRVYAGRKDHYGAHAKRVLDLASSETSSGLTSVDRYQTFAEDVKKNRANLMGLLNSFRSDGKSVAGYGAPAKGNTLLNYCGISPRLLEYTVDKSPLKVNLYTPGMHIPVLSTTTLLERQPDYVLILAWNFAEEVMRQQQQYRDRGGRFIIPLPEPRVV